MVPVPGQVIAHIPRVVFADGTSAIIDLVRSDREVPAARVFGAMVFLRDVQGSMAVVHSRRRDEWSSPGGWRESGEGARENAVREVVEETGIRVDPEALVACGYERFAGQQGEGLWQPGRDLLQAYRLDLSEVRPTLTSAFDDTSERRWVTQAEYAALCGHLFWWPLAQACLG